MNLKPILRYIVIILLLFSCNNANLKLTKLHGKAFGTEYNVSYFDNTGHDFSKQVDSLFTLVNRSMSTYLPSSDISRINQGDTTITVDNYFKEVYKKSIRIYTETHGVFDPTIGVLVNAWGFGPLQAKEKPDSSKVIQLLKLVGFNKVQIKNNKVIKQYDSIYFDFNAIAKGYAADVLGRYLETKNVNNYLIEIGGDIRARGKQIEKNSPWKIGVETPNFDGTRSIERVISLDNKAIATSGSYRKFKIDSSTGLKYAHILNTKTGYPSRTNLLSVSVISRLDLADVDGYATALMAMSLTEAKEFLKKNPKLEGFIIYSDTEGELKTFSTLQL